LAHPHGVAQGRTAHKRFKIPILINETSTYKIPWGSNVAKLLHVADLIIWDETPMTHRKNYSREPKRLTDAVDRTLQDIRKSDKPFGGIPAVFGGDSQQILLVIAAMNFFFLSFCLFFELVVRCKLIQVMRVIRFTF
jgi:PIF1-like helicase